jgi:Na+/H+-translocating membrane pyrophosphatase
MRMMLGLALVYSRDTGLRSPLAVLLLPLLSRAFSLLGTSFGTLIVRTDDRENPLAPLVRGLLVAAVLHAVGLVGAIEWLLPDRRAPLLAGALIGVAVAAVVVGWAHAVTLPASSRYVTSQKRRAVARPGLARRHRERSRHAVWPRRRFRRSAHGPLRRAGIGTPSG